MMAAFQIRPDGHVFVGPEDLGNLPGVLRRPGPNKTLLALEAAPGLAKGRQAIRYYAGGGQMPIPVDVAPEQYQKFITSSSSGKWGKFSRWGQYNNAKKFLETALTAGMAEGPDKAKVQKDLAEMKKIRIFSGGSKGKVLCFLARLVGDGHLPPGAARTALDILAKEQNRKNYNALTGTNQDYMALRAALSNVPAIPEAELLALMRSNTDESKGVTLLERALRDVAIERTLAQIPMDHFSRRAQAGAEVIRALLAGEAPPAYPYQFGNQKETLSIFWGHLIAISTDENDYFAKLMDLFACGSSAANPGFSLVKATIPFPNPNYIYEPEDVEYMGSLYEQKLRGIRGATPTFFQPAMALGRDISIYTTAAREQLGRPAAGPYNQAFPMQVQDNHWIGAILHVTPTEHGNHYEFEIFDSRLYAGYRPSPYLGSVVPRLTGLLGLPPTTPCRPLRIPPYQQPITNGTHCGPCVPANFFRAALPPDYQDQQVLPSTNMDHLRWQQMHMACEARNDVFIGRFLQQNPHLTVAQERLLLAPLFIEDELSPLSAVTRLAAIYQEEDARMPPAR